MKELGTRHELQGKEMSVAYMGHLVRVEVAGHTLQIGKPKDLGIINDPRPDDFNVIDAVRLSETSGAQGRLRLTDGRAAFFGSSVTHGFRFGPDMSRFHVGVKIKGNEIVIKDLNPINGKFTTIVIVPNS